jgi:hypothetical protein
MSVGIECLLTQDPTRAATLAKQLDSLNRERRDIEARYRAPVRNEPGALKAAWNAYLARGASADSSTRVLTIDDLLASGKLAPVSASRFQAALAAAREMGWQVVAADSAAGRIEATATTFWYGFKDDVVIRLTLSDGGTRVAHARVDSSATATGRVERDDRAAGDRAGGFVGGRYPVGVRDQPCGRRPLL